MQMHLRVNCVDFGKTSIELGIDALSWLRQAPRQGGEQDDGAPDFAIRRHVGRIDPQLIEIIAQPLCIRLFERGIIRNCLPKAFREMCTISVASRLPYQQRPPSCRSPWRGSPRSEISLADIVESCRSATFTSVVGQTSCSVFRHRRINSLISRISSRTRRLRIPCRRAFVALVALPRSVFGPLDRSHGRQL